MRAIGLDLGGTKLAGKSSTGEELLWPTETSDWPALRDQICKAVATLGGADVVALGVPGAVDPRDGSIQLTPHIPLPHDAAEQFQKIIGADLRVENDVNLAAYAEALGTSGTVSLLSFGTGLGLGTVQNGALLRGSRGLAGEIGSIPMPDGLTLEEHVSTPSILRRSALGSLPQIMADTGSADLLTDIARYGAIAVATISAIIDPDAIIIGGGIGTQQRFFDLLKAEVAKSELACDLCIASLGAKAGVEGALAYALSLSRNQRTDG